ncbi:unnamed protein product [Brachionus calyciflorus]|uniref:Uncharacterized protein n=1 Tax=Brachionus calyciflorus TaxID=104777 RepID=A0A813WKA6_9BILA|nr:unnamed protein product [Brachionus calyciflorus]
MKVRYPNCDCKESECCTRYLINESELTQQIMVYGINLHKPIDINSNQIKDVINENEKSNGINFKFKDLIEELIYRHISKPKAIYNKLILKNDNKSGPKLS